MIYFHNGEILYCIFDYNNNFSLQNIIISSIIKRYELESILEITMYYDYVIDNNVILYESDNLIDSLHEFLCYVNEKKSSNLDITTLKLVRLCKKENKKFPMIYENITITSDYILLNNSNVWLNLNNYSLLNLSNVIGLKPTSNELKCFNLLIGQLVGTVKDVQQNQEIKQVNKNIKNTPNKQEKNILVNSENLLTEISKNLLNITKTNLPEKSTFDQKTGDYVDLKKEFEKEIIEIEGLEEKPLQRDIIKIPDPNIEIKSQTKEEELELEETIKKLETFKEELDNQLKNVSKNLKTESENFANHACIVRDQELILKLKKKKEEEKKNKFISEKEFTYQKMKENLFTKK